MTQASSQLIKRTNQNLDLKVWFSTYGLKTEQFTGIQKPEQCGFLNQIVAKMIGSFFVRFNYVPF